MKTFRYLGKILSCAVVSAILATIASAQGITVERTQLGSQTSASTLAPRAKPFSFRVNVRGSSSHSMANWGPAFYKPGSGGVPQSGSSTDTNTGTLNFPSSPNNHLDYMFIHDFSTESALNAFYPMGQYGVLFQGSGAPTPTSFTTALNFQAGGYPSVTPQVVSANNGAHWSGGVLYINPVGTTTLTLNSFPEYSSTTYGSSIGVGIYSNAGSIEDASVTSYYLPTLGASDPAIQTVSIDGSWLSAGQTYTLDLQYGVFASPPEQSNINARNNNSGNVEAVSFQGLAAYYRNTTIAVKLDTSANQAPTASFSLSSERHIGETITITANLNDVNGNYSYGNLWVHTPGRGWLTIKANDSVVVSGDVNSANTVSSTPGTIVRHFTPTEADGQGDYVFSLIAFDTENLWGEAPSQTITVSPAVGNRPPTASFSLSSERTVGQTISVTVNVGDPDNNYQYANLWVHTPGRGWLTIKADDSIVVSGDLNSSNNVAASAGTVTRHFTFSASDGAGDYVFSLLAMDQQGRWAEAPAQTITVTGSAPTSNAPTASFSLSSERTIGQPISITVNVGDPNNDYRFANLWVHTPGRGWLTIKANDSVVASGDLDPANTVASAAGTVVRHFTPTVADGEGTYVFSLVAVDMPGNWTEAPAQSVSIAAATGNRPPTASFSLSSQRGMGQTISITVNVGDPDSNYRFANLWVHTPNRGWLTIKADDSIVVSGDLNSSNNVAASAGTVTRHFTFTPTDGAGEYSFSLLAMDSDGAWGEAPAQSITVN